MAHPARTLTLALLALALAAAPAAAAPGDPDPSFGGDGRVTLSARDGARLGSLALDGSRIVAAGNVLTESEDCGGADLALARLLGDGSPDAGFGDAGVQIEQFAACSQLDSREVSPPSGVVVAPDGRIFTAGRARRPGDQNGGGWVSAHMPAGPFDTSFDDDGFVYDGTISQGSFEGLVRSGDGRLTAVGHHTRLASQWEARRYLPDGSPDPSFGGGDGAASYKLVPARTHELVAAAAADGDAVVAAGWVEDRGISIARILPDGTLDPAFGDGGRTQIPGGDVHDVVRTPDGGFVMAADFGGTIALVKVSADGALDGSFGTAGRLDLEPGTARTIAADAAGRLIVAGSLGDDPFVARHLPDGTPDPAFGDEGIVRGAAGGVLDFVPADAVVQPDGRIVLGGTDTGGEQDAMAIVRLLGDETPPGRDETDGEIEDGESHDTGDPETEPEPGPGRPSGRAAGAVSIRILAARVNRRGVLVRVTWPQGTDGRARARLWTRDKGTLLGGRTVRARRGTMGRTFRVPLNARAKRMVAGGKRLKVRATARVTGLPAPPTP